MLAFERKNQNLNFIYSTLNIKGIKNNVNEVLTKKNTKRINQEAHSQVGVQDDVAGRGLGVGGGGGPRAQHRRHAHAAHGARPPLLQHLEGQRQGWHCKGYAKTIYIDGII